MNPLIKMQLFIRNLLNYDESLIKRGRENEDLDLFSDNYIVIDGIGPATPMAKSEEFDDVNESQTFGALYQRPITVDFYGDNAYDNAQNFSLLVRSQSAFDLQSEHQITVKNISRIMDVKELVGSIYGNMMQVELNIMYTDTVSIDVLRIEEAQLEIKDN